MNKIKAIITFTAFSLLVLGLPAIASAQYGGYDPYGRNNRDNDRYGNNRNGGYYGGDMRSTLRNLKNRARDFQRQVDRDLDRSRYNGTMREDQMNHFAQRFTSAVNRLDQNDFRNGGYYGDRRYNNDSDIRRVYAEAANIERTIGRARLSYQTQAIWSGIRNDLQLLSRTYGGGGYNNGGYNNGGVWGNTRTNRVGLPSWWPF